MVWKMSKSVGLFSGTVVGLTLFSIQWLLGASLSRQEMGMGFYLVGLVMLMTSAVIFVWAWNMYGLLRLRYHLDRNGLSIDGAGFHRAVPMNEIQSIEQSWVHDASQLKGIRWPGYIKGRMQAGAKPLLVYSTSPISRQLLVVTESAIYGISPRDPKGFLVDFETRRALGMVRNTVEKVEFSGLAAWAIWRDRLFWLPVIFALAANLVLIGLIMDRYPYLPERLALHFNSLGQADRIDAKEGLLIIPGIGLLALGVNILVGVLCYRWERLGSYVLAWSALGLQTILWLAALGILNH